MSDRGAGAGCGDAGHAVTVAPGVCPTVGLPSWNGRRPTEPIDSSAVWRGDDLDERAWLHQLTGAEIDDLDAALRVALASGRPLPELTPDDFPVGEALGSLLASSHDRLDDGPGFALIRGVPLDRYTDDDLRQISSDLNSDNAEDREAGEAALLAYQRSLEICL